MSIVNKEESAKELALYIWDGSAEHENYQQYIEEFNDPKDHILYHAAVILGHEQEFEKDIQKYESEV
jgi:hypothetical protein